MKHVLSMSLVLTGVLLSQTSLAASAVRSLKQGESYLLYNCSDVGANGPMLAINAILAKGEIVTKDVEIELPYSVSAPAHSMTGSGRDGWVYCAVVTITKQ